MISRDDYLYFAGRALDGMTGIVAGLGDDLANTRPPLPGANTPYALLTHCLGVIEFWSGSLVAGRSVIRDRDAEFVAAGPVAALVTEALAVRKRLESDVRDAEPQAALRGRPPESFQGPDRELNRGAALMHVYEELAQHHGQMEIMRDAIRAMA
ncbi:hypothetical protein FB565_008105 [Actinoplanes lutulentus]|uniref:Uncharacterized protein DUF664 n=1 Tax=Actinoplanes lutulentus TaxID=1287878 RepID=A0A327Z6Q1_9ACTN|nr:DUF664 domain-containing protein [Actinoplanes lutulentus]MBB2948322.1 hypothetical protein [Actinoplanes lutulentus]RAK30354.1 uncharacterized protein DUF664 [Actinoplanes lutulentus]